MHLRLNGRGIIVPFKQNTLDLSDMTIVILNGPNLNLLGQREPAVYGNQGLEDILEELRNDFPSLRLIHHQSNIEGELIEWVQQYGVKRLENADGIIINPGGYSHTSVALADALVMSRIPVVEVHLSNIYAREEYRHKSITGAVCKGVISGFGVSSYWLAMKYIEKHI